MIHLGLGEDGHTASLFPGSPALKEVRALIAQVHDAPKPPPDRLTLTLPVLNAARAVLFMVQGSSKREALARVLRRDPALPASHVQPLDGGNPEIKGWRGPAAAWKEIKSAQRAFNSKKKKKSR